MSPSPAAWALHSPRRLVAVVVVLLMAIAVLGWAATRGSDRTSATPPAPSEHEQAPATDTSSATTPDAHTHSEDKDLGAAGKRTVEKFLTKYLAPTTQKGLGELRPLATEELWSGLAAADPRNMPKGPPKKIVARADGPFTASYEVTLPQGALAVEVVATAKGPKVASVEPVAP